MKQYQITLASIKTDYKVVEFGMVDKGESNKVAAIPTPQACMWLNCGTWEDVEKASDYALKNDMVVYEFSLTENDPLSKAKTKVMRDFLKSWNPDNDTFLRKE